MKEGINKTVASAYERYRRLMLREAYAILRDYALAEDCAQEAFIALCTKLSNCEESEVNIQAFLIRTVRNIALYARRKQLREQPSDGEDYSFEIPDNEAEEERRKRENIEVVLQTVKNLPLTNWQVLKLKYEMGLRDKEISERLGLSRRKVTLLVSESMDILKKQF